MKIQYFSKCHKMILLILKLVKKLRWLITVVHSNASLGWYTFVLMASLFIRMDSGFEADLTWTQIVNIKKWYTILCIKVYYMVKNILYAYAYTA